MRSRRPPFAVVVTLTAGCAAGGGNLGPAKGTIADVPLAAGVAPGGTPSVASPIAPASPRGRVVDVGLGWQSSCALLDDTTVRCWGRNDEGQVGDGTDELRTRPTAVLGVTGLAMNEVRKLPRAPEPLRGVQQIAVGHAHACARMQDGTVRCWGKSSAGQAGSASPSLLWVPREVPALRGVVEIASGDWHTCARLAEPGTSKVRCWGGNHRGRPGTGKAGNHEEILGLTDPVKLAAGPSAACAITRDGSVACWDPRDFGVGVQHVAVRVPGVEEATDAWVNGDDGGCARKKSGEVVCWGRLGGAKAGPKPAVKQALAQLAWAQGSICSLDRSGDALCAGHRAMSLQGVRKVAPGGTHACALLATGALVCWGSTEYGQVGEGSGRVRAWTAPVQGIATATGLGRGGRCALLAGGAVACWGSNGDDLLGKGAPHHYSPVPVPFDALRGVTQLASGGSLAVALRDGKALMWSRDTEGVPTPVAGLPVAPPVVEVAAGGAHACARLASGAVWCWGSDLGGQLGRGVAPADGADSTFPPSAVRGISDAVELSLGASLSCARLASGRVKCWGRNLNGVLGDGSKPRFAAQPTPVLVKGLDDATQLSVEESGSHACALKRDGSIACWGHDTYGAFGTWDREQESQTHATPILARGIRPAVEIATSSGTTCARFADGTVQCWGGNQWGEVGDGTTEVRARPVAVAGVQGAVGLAAGESHFCARRQDGAVLCWGRADYGNLGGGEVDTREAAVEIGF